MLWLVSAITISEFAPGFACSNWLIGSSKQSTSKPTAIAFSADRIKPRPLLICLEKFDQNTIGIASSAAMSAGNHQCIAFQVSGMIANKVSVTGLFPTSRNICGRRFRIESERVRG